MKRLRVNSSHRGMAFLVIFFICVSFLPAGVVAAQEAGGIEVFLDGHPVKFPVEPRITKAPDGTGHTVVPFRKLAESLGVDVSWDASTQTIIAVGYGKTVTLPLSVYEAKVNETSYALAVAPFTDQGHTLIPLRFFSEIFGAQVEWDSINQRVLMTSPARDMYTMAFYGLGSVNQRHYIPHFDSMVYTWSRINQQGEFQISTANGNEYFWPEPLPDSSIEEMIATGTSNGGQAFLMVVAFESRGEVSAVLLDEEKTNQAIQAMIQQAVQNKLDGLLIDFEGIKKTEEHQHLKEAYTRFLEKLTKQAKENKLQVGVAVTPPNNFFSGYDYQRIGEIVDLVYIMAYDYNPKGEGINHYIPEPMNAVQQGIEQTLEFISKEKLILGINIRYETPESTKEKIGLAKRYQLKGAGFWILKGLTDEYMQQIHQSTPLKNWPSPQ